MNKNLVALFIACLFLSTLTYAQGPPAGISGQVIDNESEAPLGFATVALIHAADSTLVDGTITSEEGQFRLNPAPGNYLLKVDFISYNPTIVSIDEYTGSPLRVPAIGLQLDATQIQQVDVVAEKSELEFNLDKKVYTVGRDITAVGTNAIQVLDNVPSVTTDIDGNVSLRGSGGVQILIDGKPSGLTGLGNTNALRNLPSSSIEKVEVITNPSARYDAEGMVGIINIVLKKERASGFNASVNANTGFPDNHGAGANINYRTQKVNLFTNLGANFRRGPGSGFVFYDFTEPVSGIEFSRNDREHERGGLGGNAQFGLEYFMNDQNSLTGSFRYSKGDEENEADILYTDFDINFDPLSEILRTDREEEDEEDLAYSINFTRDIDKKAGKKLNFDFRYSITAEGEFSDLRETLLSGNGIEAAPQQRSNNEESQDEYLIQFDWINPFSKTKQFELGARSTFRDITNQFLVEQLNTAGTFEPFQNLSNDFDYNEDIAAGYAQFANEKGKWSYQLGVRGEYTNVTTLLITTEEENQRDYFNFFPSAFLTYKMPNANSFQMSYSRRLRRPRFFDLNPFLTFSDSRRQFAGNPNLDPEFTHSLETGYLKEWDKTTFNASLYYRHTEDVIQRITQRIDSITFITRPQNLNTRDAGGVELIGSSDVTNWLRFDANFNLFYFQEDGQNLGESFTSEDVSWFTRINSRFKIANKVNGQLSMNHRAGRQTTQGSTQPVTTANIGLSSDIMQNQATISFNVRDVFNSRRRVYEQFGDDFFSNGEFQWRARTSTFAFNYRINQQNRQRRRGGERPAGGSDPFDEGGGF
ncbi:MAG: TonB-dependent receptor [Saprospiraceae bacterium]|nr:TonB-dependent receptor [Saprospiraceae bacterium]